MLFLGRRAWSSVAGATGVIPAGIPGGVMEQAKLCFCLGSGGRLQGPQAPCTGQGAAAAAVKDTGTGCV